MNAILQSLFSIQSFANDLLKQGIPWKKIPLNALIRWNSEEEYFLFHYWETSFLVLKQLRVEGDVCVYT